MDGATSAAAVSAASSVLRNPVRAARKILSDSPHVYFVAEGAERFRRRARHRSLPQRRSHHS